VCVNGAVAALFGHACLGELGVFVTAKTVARKLGVSARTVRRWVQFEGLPAVKLTEKTMRFDSAAVERWIEGRKSASQ
jgi:excisionase family DNA binding protein